MQSTLSRGAVSWQRLLPVVGRCQECGEDISTTLLIWASTAWVNRYESDARLRRSVDLAVARKAVEQHQRICPAHGRRM